MPVLRGVGVQVPPRTPDSAVQAGRPGVGSRACGLLVALCSSGSSWPSWSRRRWLWRRRLPRPRPPCRSRRLASGTVVSTQYQGSHGVFFNGPPSDGAQHIVATVPGGTADSGTRVAHFATCPGCEFFTPRTVGRLTSTASRVEAYVGYLESEPNAAQATITMIARDAGGQTVGTSSTAVTEGQPFTQLVGVTAPRADDRVLRADHDADVRQPTGRLRRPGDHDARRASPRTSPSR